MDLGGPWELLSKEEGQPRDETKAVWVGKGEDISDRVQKKGNPKRDGG